MLREVGLALRDLLNAVCETNNPAEIEHALHQSQSQQRAREEQNPDEYSQRYMRAVRKRMLNGTSPEKTILEGRMVLPFKTKEDRSLERLLGKKSA